VSLLYIIQLSHHYSVYLELNDLNWSEHKATVAALIWYCSKYQHWTITVVCIEDMCRKQLSVVLSTRLWVMISVVSVMKHDVHSWGHQLHFMHRRCYLVYCLLVLVSDVHSWRHKLHCMMLLFPFLRLVIVSSLHFCSHMVSDVREAVA